MDRIGQIVRACGIEPRDGIRHDEHIRGGRRKILGESPVPTGQSDNSSIRAMMGSRQETVAAAAAADVGIYNNAIAHPERHRVVLMHGSHYAGRIMSGD